MKTEDLIEALSHGVRPTRPARLDGLAIAAAAAASILTVALVLHVREDIAVAVASPSVWIKGAYTASLAGAGLWLATRLGSPGRSIRGPSLSMAAIAGLILVLGIAEVAAAPGASRWDGLLGQTWTACGRNILIASVLPGPLVFISARRLAPTRPALSGAVLGLSTSAIAATAYGVLHCPEVAISFLAVWYTSAILIGGVIGSVAGHFALRW